MESPQHPTVLGILGLAGDKPTFKHLDASRECHGYCSPVRLFALKFCELLGCNSQWPEVLAWKAESSDCSDFEETKCMKNQINTKDLLCFNYQLFGPKVTKVIWAKWPGAAGRHFVSFAHYFYRA